VECGFFSIRAYFCAPFSNSKTASMSRLSLEFFSDVRSGALHHGIGLAAPWGTQPLITGKPFIDGSPLRGSYDILAEFLKGFSGRSFPEPHFFSRELPLISTIPISQVCRIIVAFSVHKIFEEGTFDVPFVSSLGR